MKQLGAMFGIGVSILVAIAVVWQWDDDINPEVMAFIALADLHVEQHSVVSSLVDNRAYFYLLGMDAEPGSDPVAVGRQRYINQHRDAGESSTESSYQLPLFKVEPDCKLTDAACLDHIVTHKPHIMETIDDYSVMLSRYLQFMAFDRYRLVTQPSIDEQWPSYSYVIIGNRLFLHHVLFQTPAFPLETLLHNIHRIRHRLANADSLLEKMVFLAMLDESLTVLVYLQENRGIQRPFNIAELSMAERSLSRAMARECAGMFTMNMSLANRADLFSPSPDIPLWFARIVYKPHMTINASFPLYREVARRSELTAEVFDAELIGRGGKGKIWHSLAAMPGWVRNPVGSILNGIAAPDYDEYIAHFFALDQKIATINQH
ncbi:hypothetical protein [Photobacterium nomapromontoriensis]|uniref:hypothetical protein n=1 Tax=Photobacterium nomapromontoriensis TaxID=2910237 RepID=UPI003D10091C